jgi:ATP synthase protein I
VSDVSVRDRDQPASERYASAEAEGRALGLNIGWTVFSYLLSGMAAYGAIGWLIGRAVHIPVLFPVGMLVGLAISIGFVIWRFGKSSPPGIAATSGPPDNSSTSRTPGTPGTS